MEEGLRLSTTKQTGSNDLRSKYVTFSPWGHQLLWEIVVTSLASPKHCNQNCGSWYHFSWCLGFVNVDSILLKKVRRLVGCTTYDGISRTPVHRWFESLLYALTGRWLRNSIQFKYSLETEFHFPWFFNNPLHSPASFLYKGIFGCFYAILDGIYKLYSMILLCFYLWVEGIL